MTLIRVVRAAFAFLLGLVAVYIVLSLPLGVVSVHEKYHQYFDQQYTASALLPFLVFGVSAGVSLLRRSLRRSKPSPSGFGSATYALSTVPAGWYRDPTGATRWWDGARWTEHLRD